MKYIEFIVTYFTIYIWEKKKSPILFHSRRAEQTFTRIWLLGQLLGVGLLPLRSLPTARLVISMSPNTGDPTLHAPSLYWHYILLCVCVCVTSPGPSWAVNRFLFSVCVFHPHSKSRLAWGGKKVEALSLSCLLWLSLASDSLLPFFFLSNSL